MITKVIITIIIICTIIIIVISITIIIIIIKEPWTERCPLIFHFISASEILGKVAVNVVSVDDTWNSPDETEFEYHSIVTKELQKQISTIHTKRNTPLDYQTLNPSRSAGTGQTLSLFLKLYTAYGILFCDYNRLIKSGNRLS